MNIVYALTRNVYKWILPSIRSLAAHNPRAKVFILAEDDAMPFDLPMRAEVINISSQGFFPEIAAHRREAFGGYINHLKVCYPSILPVNKVIHLDIDTIVCDTLEELWNTDVAGKWFAAVPERQTWYRPFGGRYYNMGVALINLAQMRKDKAPPMMAEYLLASDQPFADQNAWNKFGSELDKAAVLGLRFNESMVTGKTDNPAVVHYCAIPDWWTNRFMDRRGYLDKYMEAE